ncbi:ribosomal protein S5 domain 2-type protein [Aspergillus egyptiacus]|nr:ribosomal protein S5 domain 2-type protein [Aspergillus egyptiacus]
MAWQTSVCVANAMQSIRSTTSLRAFLSQRPMAPAHVVPGALLLARTKQQTNSRGYATELQPAAPEINFDNFQTRPARIVPMSPSYFSGSPKFIDHLLRLEHLLARYESVPTVTAAKATRMAFLKYQQFREFLGEPVPMKKYKGLVKILQRLSRMDPNLMPQEVRETLQTFLRPGNPFAHKPAPPTVDELGRARGKGKRKASSAVVHLVEGEGEVLVNGKTLAEAFPRIHDRESATWALRCTSRLDKYNLWATVRGGGTTGQAEAITLALGRALLVHEPALKPILRKAGVITVDPRRVERKKPGHLKARKMPTWVKR